MKWTKKFYNVTGIARNIFNYAVDLEILEDNVFAKTKVPKNMLVKKHKPNSEGEVFSRSEEQKLRQFALEEYKNPYTDNIYYLMIPFAFLTGMRIGEMAALKWEDVNIDHIYVHQSYKRKYVSEGSEMRADGFEVVNSLKMNAPPRKIPLTSHTKKILELVREYYDDRGLDPQFIFTRNNQLANPNSVYGIWHRACDKCNIPRRSPHKSRKTFISGLIDANIPLNTIREISGHEDERTTLKNYCFTRENDGEILGRLEKIHA